MKILHVITDLKTGGAEKLMVDLLPKLKKSGHTVALCVFNGEEMPFLCQIRNQGIAVHSFGEKPNYYNPLNIFKLIRLSRNFDIVHTHNTAPQLFGAVSSFFSKCKWILTEHTTTSHHRIWWYNPIERWMYHCYDKVVCISEAVKESTMPIVGKRYQHIEVIPNGIEISKYRNAEAFNRFSIGMQDSDKKIIMMVGRYSYQKDQATIIKAISILPGNIELWLAGYGETEDMLQQLAIKLNVRERVHLLGMRSDVPSLLATADIVVQSSHIEGFGLAAVEAMASGKPVIATDIPGLNDVVSGAGLLFEHENERQLAMHISNLLTDHTLYNEIARRCKKRATMYSIDQMADNYIRVYNQCISQTIN